MSNYKTSWSNLVFRCLCKLLRSSARFQMSFGLKLKIFKKRALTKTSLNLFKAIKRSLRWTTIWFEQWTKYWSKKNKKIWLWEHNTASNSTVCHPLQWTEPTSRAFRTTKVNCSKLKLQTSRSSQSTQLTSKGLFSLANPGVIWPRWSLYRTLAWTLVKTLLFLWSKSVSTTWMKLELRKIRLWPKVSLCTNNSTL